MRNLVARRICVVALLVVTAGCNALDVSDPTAVQESDLANANGAALLRNDIVGRYDIALQEGAFATGVLSDEMWGAEYELDERRATATAGYPAYYAWKELLMRAAVALPHIEAHAAPQTRNADVAEILALRGLATLSLGEDFCAGVPLHDMRGFAPQFGTPLSTTEILERALILFDSVATRAGVPENIAHLSAVGRARALLALGKLAEARQAASTVPVSFSRMARYSASSFNRVGYFWERDFDLAVGAPPGVNGFDFVATDDPRLPLRVLPIEFLTTWYASTKYSSASSPIVVASGVEARLIEAEASLAADPGSAEWLDILNVLRTNGTFTTRPDADDPSRTDTVWNAGTGGVSGLRPLDDPGTANQRVDLIFRERGYWLYGTGRRLADLRRLVAHYGRAVTSLYPSGEFYLGGEYGPATSLPFPAAAEAPFSPGLTGCTAD